MSDPRPPRWLKPMNKIMIAVQKLGIPTGPAMVLTVPGRQSGRPRSTPMTPFTHPAIHSIAIHDIGHELLLNARAAGAGTLARGRKSQRVKIVELTADEARPVLRSYPVEVPTGIGFMKRSGLVHHGTPEEFEALAGRCAVFRFDPIPTP